MAKIIAMQECSDGNETIGDKWIEPKSFDESATLAEVIKWARSLRGSGGRLIIREESPRA